MTPASPALLIAQTVPTNRLLVAGHRVAATEVTVFQFGISAVDVLPVVHEQDARGQTVATVDLTGSALTVDTEDEYAAGWSREAGGGVLHRGRPVEGLGDLLAWGADTLSSAVHDAGEMEARRSALNRFKVDTCVNESILWADWLEGNVLETFGLEEAQGRHGVYYQERRYTTDRRLVRGRLVTGTAGGGYRVERVAAVSDSDEEVQNAITVAYVPFASSHAQFVERHTIDPSPRTGIEVEDIRLRDPRCDYSERLFGRREATYETALTSDPATAIGIAGGKAARHALPKQVTVYQGGRDLLDFRKYDVVSVNDTSPGAYFVDDLAIVVGIQIVDASTVALTVEIDTDPLRNPTVRTT